MEDKELLRIIELFSIENKAKKVYRFLDDYTEKINKWLNGNRFNSEQILRYMLVGFFPEYRGYIHRNEKFNTLIDDNKKKLRKEKNNKFNEKYGNKIKSTKEYLELLTLKETKNINGQKLFEFVISNKNIN